ncbi:MAG: PASTA domain-containing protein [Actinomycetota bacterium]
MTDRDELAGEIVATRYRLDALRKGGADSSSVYEATDLRGSRSVVVRLVSVGAGGDAMESFKRQLLAVAGVSHSVLVSPLDWGEAVIGDSRYAFVVTERIDGVSLRELLDRGRRLSVSQAVVLALDLCRALHHLHQLGLAHGDVRPANVFVSTDSRARLAGLGVKGVGTASIEQARYAAPEFAADVTPTAASDMYALALTMLETLTGDVPYAADSTAVTLANRAGKLLPVSADIGAVAVPIEKAGRPDAADRASALEFGQALAQLAGKLPPPEPLEALSGESFRDSITRTLEAIVVAPQPTPEPVAPQPTTPISVDVAIAAAPGERRRYRWLVSVVAVAAVIVAGVLVWQTLTTESYEVPDLIGVAEGEARNSVALFDWNIAIRAERSDEVELGAVIRTVPPAGSLLREGSDFTLVVSEGATLAIIPDVTGLSREDAVAALTAQGLTVSEIVRDSDSVPVGRVLAWIVTEQPNLIAGSQVLKGTQVGIVVSGGPVLRSVPNLIGRTEDDTRAQLAAVQLVGQRNDDVYSSQVAVGLVASQDPAPGQQMSRESVVAYSLSKGIEQVPLPAIIGLTLNEAQKILGEAGIGVATVSGRSTSKVRSVNLDGVTLKVGDPVPKGSAVNLVFP